MNIVCVLYSVVKMSSPNLNNLIIVGSILGYISVIIGGLDKELVIYDTYVTLCQVSYYFSPFHIFFLIHYNTGTYLNIERFSPKRLNVLLLLSTCNQPQEVMDIFGCHTLL